MEPLVVFSAGLVIYCGYIALHDAVRDRERSCAGKTEQVKGKKLCAAPGRAIFSDHDRGDGADTHWPRLAKGSA